MISRSAGIPESPSAWATSAANPGSCSWQADTLTAIVPGASGPYVLIHSAPCRTASRSTQRPSGTISPFSSATGTNAPGPSRPPVGCCQRTSASTPMIRCSGSDTTGW